MILNTEIMQISKNWWTNEQNVYIHMMEYYSVIKKEQTTDILTDESQWHYYVMFKKPDTKHCILHILCVCESYTHDMISCIWNSRKGKLYW